MITKKSIQHHLGSQCVCLRKTMKKIEFLILVSSVTFLFPRLSPFFIQLQINNNLPNKHFNIMANEQTHTHKQTQRSFLSLYRFIINKTPSHNETVTDKIQKYRSDYNNNPPNVISCIPTTMITSTVDTSTSTVCRSPHILNHEWATFSSRLKFYVFHLTQTGLLSHLSHILTHRIRKLLVY